MFFSLHALKIFRLYEKLFYPHVYAVQKLFDNIYLIYIFITIFFKFNYIFTKINNFISLQNILIFQKYL